MPGTTLVEMAHHGSDTLCCGKNAILSYPETGMKIAMDRMAEAQATGAKIMIDVCQSCHGSFVETWEKAGNCTFLVENYVTYIRRALEGRGPRERS
jgi:heterodisulfide reductase subunit B